MQPRQNQDFPVLTVGQVAAMLNVHANTVRRWCERGMLRPIRIGPRGDRRFRRSDVDQLMAIMDPENETTE